MLVTKDKSRNASGLHKMCSISFKAGLKDQFFKASYVHLIHLFNPASSFIAILSHVQLDKLELTVNQYQMQLHGGA